VRKSAVVLAAMTVLAGGCVSGGERAHPPRSDGPVAGPSPSHAGPIRLPRLVLTADLGERPARWDLVATVEFGSGDDRLGLYDDPAHTPFPHFAPSFAVGPDGSLWFLDEPQRRVARFSSSGRFLSAVGGLFFDRFHPHVQDLAFAGADVFVLQVDHSQRPPDLLSDVSPISDGTDWSWHGLHHEDRPVVADYLIQGVAVQMAQLHGFANFASGGPVGDVRVDPSGAVTPTPGIPVAPDRWMDLEAAADAGEPNATEQDFDLILTGPEATTIQPIHIRVVGHQGAETPSLGAIVGVEATCAIPDGIVAYVQLSPSRPADAVRYGGGHWLLKLSDDGSALWWERLPEPTLPSEVQVRHLSVSADGGVYLMLARPDGLSIYRRP
jgi:hypothetical protein